ncbi:MAG: hypothetical protein CMF71_03400 [Magnetovibrio sp.]|nr:hypothetical protein [Magnetovibrio sp.]|tara:strand:+ start:349 stop:828 length:480 start_codon:yes stop_codon:yes gene_type:complete
MSTFDFAPMLRYSVGFDRMQRQLNLASTRTEATYPPYNIETDGDDSYRVTVAVAGFDKKEISITLEDDKLKIIGEKDASPETVTYLHRGIASRSFNLNFNLADHIKVIDASLINGVLTVDLERVVPEALKPRQISINTHKVKPLTNKSNKTINAQGKAA